MINNDILTNLSVSKRLHVLAKDTVIYGLSAGLSKFLFIFLMPILTRLLTKEEYGLLDALNIMQMFLIPLIIFDFDQALSRYFYKNNSFLYKQKLISETFLMILILSLIFTLLSYIFSLKISHFYLGTTKYSLHVFIQILTIPFIALIRISTTVFRLNFSKFYFLLISLGSSATFLFLSCLLIIFYDQSVYIVLLTQLIVMSFFSLLGLFILRKYIIFKINIYNSIRMIKFAFPLTVSSLILFALSFFERLFITHYLGLSFLGLYAVASKLSNILKLANSGFISAWNPIAYSVFGAKAFSDTYQISFHLYIIIACILSLVIVFVSSIAINIIATSGYIDCLYLIPFLLFGNIFFMAYDIVSLGIKIEEKTYLFIISQLISFLSFGIFVFFTIKHFQIISVAIGFLLSRLVLFLVINKLNNYFTNVCFGISKSLFVIFISFMLSILQLYVFYNFEKWFIIIVFLVNLTAVIFVSIHFLSPVSIFFIFNKFKQIININAHSKLQSK